MKHPSWVIFRQLFQMPLCVNMKGKSVAIDSYYTVYWHVNNHSWDRIGCLASYIKWKCTFSTFFFPSCWKINWHGIFNVFFPIFFIQHELWKWHGYKRISCPTDIRGIIFILNDLLSIKKKYLCDIVNVDRRILYLLYFLTSM